MSMGVSTDILAYVRERWLDKFASLFCISLFLIYKTDARENTEWKLLTVTLEEFYNGHGFLGLLKINSYCPLSKTDGTINWKGIKAAVLNIRLE